MKIFVSKTFIILFSNTHPQTNTHQMNITKKNIFHTSSKHLLTLLLTFIFPMIFNLQKFSSKIFVIRPFHFGLTNKVVLKSLNFNLTVNLYIKRYPNIPYRPRIMNTQTKYQNIYSFMNSFENSVKNPAPNDNHQTNILMILIIFQPSNTFLLNRENFHLQK